MHVIDRAIKALGENATQADLARALEVTSMCVSQWRRRGVPPEWCRKIERVTGGAVKRHELRPDLFDPPATLKECEAVAG